MKIKLYRLSLTRYLLAFFFFLSISFKAQNAFLISFPVDPPPSLTTCFGSSKLTVQLDATIASTTGGDVTIQLATGVNYVPGSVALVSTIGGLSIAENGGTANAPKFIVSPATLSPGNRIVFTIDRTATCATRTHALASGIFKDTVTASIGASSDTKASSSYQINYPVLTFTQPAAQNNAVVGTTYTRTFNIKNGGNGCLSQLYLSLDNPSSGIQQISLQVTKHGTTSITPITITPTSTSGTTTYYTVPSSALPGGDLCTNEDITITETYKVLKCNAVTNYSAGWGCDPAPANWCETKTGSGSISMATGVPNVFYLANSAVKVKGANFCDNAIITATIKNQGSETVAGAGTAFNLIQLLGMDGGEAINVRAPLGITNVQISDNSGGWINLTQTGGGTNTGTPATINFSQLTTDPDGANGLVDADGDGQFDDLPVGRQISIRYEIIVPCQSTCASQSKSGVPSFQSKYNDQCGTSITGTKVMGPSNLMAVDRSSSSTLSAPADILNGQTATIKIYGTRDFFVNNSIYTCPTNKLVLTIVAPKGYSINAGRFYKGGLGTTDTSGTGTVTTISGTTTNTFVIEGFNSLGNVYGFEADLSLDCATYNGGDITYTVGYTCDAACTTCIEIVSCGTVPMLAHCPAPCTDGGLSATDVKYERTNVGYATPTSTGTYANASSLPNSQLATVLPYDTVKGIFIGKKYPNTNGITLNGDYFKISYPQISGQNILIPGSGILKITSASTGTTQTCTIAAPVTNSVISGTHSIVYDLASCGIPINDNDVVDFQPNFTIVNNTGFPQVPTQVSGLVTKFYSTSTSTPGTEYKCDAFSGQLIVHQYAKRRFDGTGSIVNNGCANFTYASQFNLTTLSYDPYPNEIRPFTILDKIVVESLGGDNFNGVATLQSRGTNLDGYGSGQAITTNLIPYVTYSNNNKTATYTNDGTWPLADIGNSLANNGYYANIGFTNGCESQALGTIRVTYYYKDYGYAYNMPSIQVSATNIWSNTVQNTLSSITLTNLSGSIQASKFTESFNVRLSNSGTVNTPYTWLAVPTLAGVNVTQIVDVATNTPLTLIPYSGGVWVKLSTTGLASGTFKDYRINFTYTTCSSTTFQAIAGWNCSGYPSDPIAYACTASKADLTFEPQPAAVQINTIAQPVSQINLCTVLNYEFQVNSAAAGNLINNKFNITLPAGLTITTGSLLVEYPAGAGNWQAVTTTTSGYTTKLDLTAHSNYPAQGIPGILNDGGNANNRLIGIKFNATTDCSFTSDSYVMVSTDANKTCGQPATGSGSLLNTITLKVSGADPGYALSSTITNPTTPITDCVSPITMHVKRVVVLSTASGTPSTATLRVNYPQGYTITNTTPNCYATTTFCPTLLNTGTDSVSGLGYAVYSIPAGMQTSDFLEFDITFTPTGSLSNGNYSTTITTDDVINGLSCSSVSGGYCTSAYVRTSTATYNFTLLCYCYKPAVTSGTALDTNHGITALGRAGADNSNWPMVRKGAWTALEAKTKGFVVNRLRDDQVSAIPSADLREGMMVYNITQDCLQINIDGTATGWRCFNTQTCPD